MRSGGAKSAHAGFSDGRLQLPGEPPVDHPAVFTPQEVALESVRGPGENQPSRGNRQKRHADAQKQHFVALD